MSDDVASDNEDTNKRQRTPRVQPTPPGVDPSLKPASNRVVQPVPPEFMTDAAVDGSDIAEDGETRPDWEGTENAAGDIVDEIVDDANAADSGAVIVPDGQLAATAPFEVVIVPSSASQKIDLLPTEPSPSAQPVTASMETSAAVDAATTVQAMPPEMQAVPPETMALPREIVPAANRSGPLPAWAPAPNDRARRDQRRSVVPLVVLAIVAAMLLGGGVAAWWVSRNAPDRAATRDSSATSPPGTAGSVTPTSAANPTVAKTSPPQTTASVPPSMATPATAAPTNPTTPPATQNTVPGDLALDQPMRRPACDGQFIVITANAVTPGTYPQEVGAARQRFIGSAYLRTDQTCSSLRAADDLGNPIYSVYYGPFPTLAKACEIRNQVGGDSYIKILDGSTPFEKIWEC